MHGVTVLLTAATISFLVCALEVLTSLSLLIIPFFCCNTPGTGAAQPKQIFILHIGGCEMSVLHSILDMNIKIRNTK